jgi:hypothetical protein
MAPIVGEALGRPHKQAAQQDCIAGGAATS